jgi:hypothetical protein
MKSQLMMSTLSFLMFVEVGTTNNGGWWNSGSNFHIQVEDIGDCFKVMYPGKVPIIFTDWSQGHARKRPDGLDINRMNKGFSGKQVASRDSIVKNNCWGPFSYEGMLQKPIGAAKLKQSFIFQESDEGPCYMSSQQRLATKYDRVVPGETRKEHMSVEELRKNMKRGLDVPPQHINEMTKSQLKKRAEQKGLSHYRLVPKLEVGWAGKQKGMLQILWETGWVDGSKYKGEMLDRMHAKGGKKNASGEIMQELTMLQ